MDEDLQKLYDDDDMKADELALRKFRKNVGNPERRKYELEILLNEELEKPEEMQDAQKIAWLQEELKSFTD